MPITAHLRRVPQQERSRAKLQLALDAADEILALEGAEALTTTRVAERAGVSVGTLYQYFPDKEAIVEELAREYWRSFAATVEEVASNPGAAPVAAVLDALADGFRSQPGFRALWFGGLRTERIRDATRSTREEMAAAIERILAHHRPGAPRAQRALVARMLVIAGDGLLREAFRMNPRGDRRVLAEGRAMLEAYIEARL